MSTVSIIQGDPANIVIARNRQFLMAFVAYGMDENGLPTEPLDLTGYTASAEMRAWPEDDAPLYATFETGKLNTDTGELDALDDTGEVWLRLDNSITATLTKSGVYDIKLIQPDTEPIDMVCGKAIVKQTVTA